MQHFSIIQALCRSTLSNPSSAIIHQIERLRDALEKEGDKKDAKALNSLLTATSKGVDMAPSSIQRSFVLGGEELTPRTPIPVDKESSTPLAELIFKGTTPIEAPVFEHNVQVAIESILNEWRNYDKLTSIQALPAKSCLIYGAPGTGKTHLATWIAQQMDMPIVLARLDGLMSSFLGTSSRNIGNLFSFAARYKCILLLDEFDAIAKLRNDPQEVGEIKRVVNTLLQSLDARRKDGFTIGVTNHESLLDPAIWRRFDVQIEIPKPSTQVISRLIEKFLMPLTLTKNEINFLSWVIENASGADAESLVKWLKKSYVLEPDSSLIDLVRKFSVLNSGRIDAQRRNILTGSEDMIVIALYNETRFEFKQKDIAALIGRSESAVSKIVTKNK